MTWTFFLMTGILCPNTSDVCKCHLFISNVTDNVFECVKTTFEMDYSGSLKFQLLPAESTVTNEQSSQTNIPGIDEVLKGA